MGGLIMKREEQIICEAKKHYSDSINCHNAFLHGVEWADKHPVDKWHDASEEPEFGREIITIDIYENSVSGVFGKLNNYKGVFYNYSSLCHYWSAITKWAYIKDLLPKGGEE